jgi:P-type conjugative transfer protein TrbL
MIWRGSSGLLARVWALMGEDNVVAQLIRKVLYVAFFALLLNNFKALADIIFQSFAGLGLKASGASLTAADLMRPGFVASTGFTASRPLLEKAGELIGITSFFTNFVTIVVLMLAWLIVLLAFFVLSVQLFITIIGIAPPATMERRVAARQVRVTNGPGRHARRTSVDPPIRTIHAAQSIRSFRRAW